MSKRQPNCEGIDWIERIERQATNRFVCSHHTLIPGFGRPFAARDLSLQAASYLRWRDNLPATLISRSAQTTLANKTFGLPMLSTIFASLRSRIALSLQQAFPTPLGAENTNILNLERTPCASLRHRVWRPDLEAMSMSTSKMEMQTARIFSLPFHRLQHYPGN